MRVKCDAERNLKAGDEIGDGKVVIMKNFSQKGENPRSQLEGKVFGEKRLIDETREIIDGQRRLECLNGQ